MGLTLPRLTFSQRSKLLWGKVRRFYLALFRRRYVRDNLARRHGECRRCGACCALGYRCAALRESGDITECRFHKYRPSNCRLFPIDERDLADRDLILPDTPCGFHFGQQDGQEDGQEDGPEEESASAQQP